MTDKRAIEAAKDALENIKVMVKRLKHAQECQGDEDCELSDAAILDGLQIVGNTVTADERAEYHDVDAALNAITDDPLSVEVRTDWHTPGEDTKPTEYRILLATGGPAVQIIGTLNQWGEPETAKLQFQDWFTPWEDLETTSEEEEALITYARQFYFGE